MQLLDFSDDGNSSEDDDDDDGGGDDDGDDTSSDCESDELPSVDGHAKRKRIAAEEALLDVGSDSEELPPHLEGEDESEDDDDDDDDDEEGGRAGGILVTSAMVMKWKVALENPAGCGARHLREVLAAFRSACKVGNETAEETIEHHFDGPSAYNKLILIAVRNVAPALHRALGCSDGVARAPDRCERWPKMKPLAKSLIDTQMHLTENLADAGLLAVLLRNQAELVPFLGALPQVGRKYLKRMICVWESATESVRMQAFLNIRALAMELPHVFLDKCIKGVYVAFARNSR